VPLAKRYDRMLEQCANLNAARQARQDSLTATITQISSAALLAVPGFLLASVDAASAWNGWLKLGLAALALALLSAMAEQHFSAVAHAKHIKIVEKYYLLESSVREDKKSRLHVKIARQIAYGTFVAAIILTSAGLFQMGPQNGKKPHSNAVASPTTA